MHIEKKGVKVLLHVAKCSKCFGEMKFDRRNVLEKKSFLHCCNGCGELEYLDQIYPCIVYDVEGKETTVVEVGK